MNFGGRSVVITGGTGGLGKAVVEAFLEKDAHCHVTYLLPDDLNHFDQRDHDRVTLHQLDLTNDGLVSALYQHIDDLAASIHLAGGFAMGEVADTTADDFRDMFEKNALTCMLCCREAIKAMRRRKHGPGAVDDEDQAASDASRGRIVNVSARPTVAPAGGMVAYTTSKAAVASITQCLAEEVEEEQILINAIMPSVIDTPANRKNMPDANFDKWPKPCDIAREILFLASSENRLTNGALIPVFGRS